MTQLNCYLLRTLCTDLFDLLLIYVAKDHGVTLPSENKFSVKVSVLDSNDKFNVKASVLDTIASVLYS